MRLWTFQNPAVYEAILKNGKFSVSNEFATTDYLNAYDWLTGIMKKRIGRPPTGVKYPIWAWYTIAGKNISPIDSEYADTFNDDYYKTQLLFELEIPNKKVLLSNFDGWHSVLNNGYLSMAESSEKIEKEHKLYGNNSKKIHESWLNIFKFNKWGTKASFQATFWEIRKEYIISVRTI